MIPEADPTRDDAYGCEACKEACEFSLLANAGPFFCFSPIIGAQGAAESVLSSRTTSLWAQTGPNEWILPLIRHALGLARFP